MDQKKSGDPFVFPASVYNEISRAVNHVAENMMNARNGRTFNKLPAGMVYIQNSTSAALAEFSAVAITGVSVTPTTDLDAFKFGPPYLTASTITSDYKDYPFAITVEPIEKNAIGRAMLVGITPAKVTIKDNTHRFAKPTENSASGAMESCAAGTARILWKASASGEQWTMLQLGGGGAEAFNGAFALSLNQSNQITCAGGYLNRNGEVLLVPQLTVEPSAGYICIYSTISGTSWTTPQLKIVSSLTNEYFPVGKCEITSQSEQQVVNLTQYHAAEAFIIITGDCPVNATS